MAASAPETSAGRQFGRASPRTTNAMRPRPGRAHTPLRTGDLFFLLSTLQLLAPTYCFPPSSQLYVVCKDAASKICVTWPVDLESATELTRQFHQAYDVDHCGLSDLKRIPPHRKYIKAVNLVSSTTTTFFCNTIILKPGEPVLPLENVIPEIIRTRRQAPNYRLRGRYRGQTQSQYLSIDRGNGKDEGKAEAHSAADSSRAIVSGNSGMGQAQSQTIYDPSCEDCVGRSDTELASLTRGPNNQGKGQGLYNPDLNNNYNKQGQKPGTSFHGSNGDGSRPNMAGEGQNINQQNPPPNFSTNHLKPLDSNYLTNQPGENDGHNILPQYNTQPGQQAGGGPSNNAHTQNQPSRFGKQDGSTSSNQPLAPENIMSPGGFGSNLPNIPGLINQLQPPNVNNQWTNGLPSGNVDLSRIPANVNGDQGSGGLPSNIPNGIQSTPNNVYSTHHAGSPNGGVLPNQNTLSPNSLPTQTLTPNGNTFTNYPGSGGGTGGPNINNQENPFNWPILSDILRQRGAGSTYFCCVVGPDNNIQNLYGSNNNNLYRQPPYIGQNNVQGPNGGTSQTLPGPYGGTGQTPTGQNGGTGQTPNGQYGGTGQTPTSQYGGTGQTPTGQYSGSGQSPTGQHGGVGQAPTGQFESTGTMPSGQYGGTGQNPNIQYGGAGQTPNSQFGGSGLIPTAQQGGNGQPPIGQYGGTGQNPIGHFGGTGQIPSSHNERTGHTPSGQYGGIGQIPSAQYGGIGQIPTGQYGGTGQTPTGTYVGTGQLSPGQYSGTSQVPTGTYGGQNPSGQFGGLGQIPTGQYGRTGQIPTEQHGETGQGPIGLYSGTSQTPSGQIGLPGQTSGQVGGIGQNPSGQYGGTGQTPTGQYLPGSYSGSGQTPTGQIGGTFQPPPGQYGSTGQPPTGQYGGTGQTPTGQNEGKSRPPAGQYGGTSQTLPGPYRGTGQSPTSQNGGTGQTPNSQYGGTGQTPTSQYGGTGQTPTNQYGGPGQGTSGYYAGTGQNPIGQVGGTGQIITGPYGGTGQTPTGQYGGPGLPPTGPYGGQGQTGPGNLQTSNGPYEGTGQTSNGPYGGTGQTINGVYGGTGQTPKGPYGGTGQTPNGPSGGTSQTTNGPYGGTSQIPNGPYGSTSQTINGPYGGTGQTPNGPYGGTGQTPNGPYGGTGQTPNGPYGGTGQTPKGPYGGTGQTPNGPYGGAGQTPNGLYGGTGQTPNGPYGSTGQTPNGAYVGTGQTPNGPYGSTGQTPNGSYTGTGQTQNGPYGSTGQSPNGLYAGKTPNGPYGPTGLITDQGGQQTGVINGGQGFNNQGNGAINNEFSGIGEPQNVIDPNSISSSFDDYDSEAQASVAQAVNGTTALASSKGGNEKGRAQTQVEGTYSGTGSFSANAEISDDNKAAQSHVSGSKKGASSSSEGRGRKNKSQASVKLGSETGSILTDSQSSGDMHSSSSQVQGSVKGGMADAQAKGPGSTSSQAQIGFTPYKEEDKEKHDILKSPFEGGGTASAQSSRKMGTSQSQLRGTFKYGISYNGAAQAGSSLDKDAVFSNLLPFDKIDVFDENNKNINVEVTTTENVLGVSISNTEYYDQSTTTEETENEYKENKENEYIQNKETDFSDHQHLDHHKTNSQVNASTRAPPIGNRRSFHTNYANNGADYEYPTDKDDPPEEYEIDDGFGSDGNENAPVEQGEYANYDDIPRDTETTHQSLQSTNKKPYEIKQTTGGNTQHIILGSLNNHDAKIIQRNSDHPDETRVYQPGEKVPGMGGYTIPVGFTGSVKSVASKDKTYVVGSKYSPSQAQTVNIEPGTGKIKYLYPSNYGKNVNPKELRSLYHPKPDDNRYVSVSKSVTRDLDSESNIRKQYSHTYYTKSSSCGYFTFTCTMVSSAEGKKKVCKPKIPTNPDGTPMRC